jgi:DNA-directed RNA polymerase subunit beta
MLTNQTERLNFASQKNIPDYPDFLDVQVKSFKDFFQLETKSDERGDEGLSYTFMENFPITDTRNNFVLEFLLLCRPTTLYNSRMYRKRSYL